MSYQIITITLSLTALVSCASDTPAVSLPDLSHGISYLSSGVGEGSNGDQTTNECTFVGKHGKVVIGKLEAKPTWRKRTCGDTLPESSYEYTFNISHPIVGRTSIGDKLVVDGLVSLQPISEGSAGQTFLLAYREIQGRNVLYRWVEIVPTEAYELADSREFVDLPGTMTKLIEVISNASSCDVRTPGLEVDEAMVTIGWGSDECGFDPIQADSNPEINEENDL